MLEFDKASHTLYKGLKEIRWYDLPEPVSKGIRECVQYTYCEDRLYLFRQKISCNRGKIWDVYFMAKGGSPWEALVNHSYDFHIE